MTSSLVSLRIDERVAVVRLERPESLNAISGALADELTSTLEKVAGDPDVWVVVLAAAGEKAFCVGADLKERNSFSLEDFYDNRAKMRAMFAAVRDLPQPAIASVFGHALGGGFELALSCDLIVAAQGAKFGLPETRVGLLPAGGGTQLLPRKVGMARAKELIFRARLIDVHEAQALGLVAEVTEREELDEWTMKVARDLCRSSPIGLREAKRAIDAGIGVPLPEAFDIEHDAWTRVIASDDRKEGIAAFNEKREPQWKNR